MTEDVPILQEELVSVIRDLRQPAGDDPRFSSLESITANQTAFLSRVHDTWKRLHNHSLQEILKIESLARAPDAKRYPKEFSEFLRYVELIWRRTNDAIVWSLFNMEGHYIRRMCLRKPRPVLSESNHKALIPLIEQLNSDPLTFALWSDATCCVDIGDVISRSFSGKPSGLLEVKSGAVNEAILDLIHSKDESAISLKSLEALAFAHGDNAIKQMGRILRQMQTNSQVSEVLMTDKGFDPLHKLPIEIKEAKTKDHSYDKMLASYFEISDKMPVLECIEGCLWVYIDQDPNKTYEDRIKSFTKSLYERDSRLREWNKDRYGLDHLREVVPLNANLMEPFAIPIFYRPFEPERIEQVVLGKLYNRVLLYFDWQNYERIFEDLGAHLTWSTTKRARAESSVPHEKRTVVIGNRIPVVSLSTGEKLEGYSKIYRVFFEGILPSVIAAQYIEMLKMQSKTKEE